MQNLKQVPEHRLNTYDRFDLERGGALPIYDYEDCMWKQVTLVDGKPCFVTNIECGTVRLSVKFNLGPGEITMWVPDEKSFIRFLQANDVLHLARDLRFQYEWLTQFTGYTAILRSDGTIKEKPPFDMVGYIDYAHGLDIKRIRREREREEREDHVGEH